MIGTLTLPQFSLYNPNVACHDYILYISVARIKLMSKNVYLNIQSFLLLLKLINSHCGKIFSKHPFTNLYIGPRHFQHTTIHHVSNALILCTFITCSVQVSLPQRSMVRTEKQVPSPIHFLTSNPKLLDVKSFPFSLKLTLLDHMPVLT